MKFFVFKKLLLEKYKIAEIDNSEAIIEIDMIFKSVLNLDKKDILLQGDFEISFSNIEKINTIIEERVSSFTPIQYLLEEADFMGEKFFVNKDVLIPRQETELLVNKVVELAKQFKTPKILDIGSGSGCITCMCASMIKNATVKGLDISKAAINVAEKNAEKLSLKNIKFIESDIFSKVNEKFDIIVSNPPYIPFWDKKNLEKEVLNEPAIALFTNDDKGMEFYQQIIEQAHLFLNQNGVLLFEIGIYQAQFIQKLLIDSGFSHIELINDLENNIRIITAKLN